MSCFTVLIPIIAKEITAKSGASYIAMMFLSNWLNQYGRAKKFPIQTEYLSGDQVRIAPHSKIVSALQQGGTVFARVIYGNWHYVLLTGYDRDRDPYYRIRSFRIPNYEIELINNASLEKNHRIPAEMMNSTEKNPYALGDLNNREAVLFFNKNTRKTQENTIEYFI